MDKESIVVVELEDMQIKAIKKAKDEKELEVLLNQK
jgi:hypothetical protein